MATHTVTPTPRVLILGHSFIRCLQKFIEHHTIFECTTYLRLPDLCRGVPNALGIL